MSGTAFPSASLLPASPVIKALMTGLPATTPTTTIESPVAPTSLTSVYLPPVTVFLPKDKTAVAKPTLSLFSGTIPSWVETRPDTIHLSPETLPVNDIPDATNPLLDPAHLPRFDKIKAKHVVPTIKKLVRELTAEFEAIEANPTPTWQGLIVPLNEISYKIGRAWSPIDHLTTCNATPAMRTAHETAQQDMIDFGQRTGQSRPIYDALKTIKNGPEWDHLAEWQKRVIDGHLQGMELSGIGLDGAKRARFNEIGKLLAGIEKQFKDNVVDDTERFSLAITDKSELAGLDDKDLKRLSAAYNEKNPDAAPKSTPESGPWLLSLQISNYLPVMTKCSNRALREKLSRAMSTVASKAPYDNTPLIRDILRLRREEANLLGLPSYAALSLETKMAPSVAAVFEFEDKLRGASRQAALKDLEDLKPLAKADGIDDIRPWDVAYYADKLQQKEFEYDEESLRPYFPLEKVLDGAFALFNRLFGVTFKPADGEAPVWADGVRLFKVLNASGEQISWLYYDPFERAGVKKEGAWENGIRSRRINADGTLGLPVASVNTNFAAPQADGTVRGLSFDEAQTVLHEMGHALVDLVATMDFDEISGNSGIEWDAIEMFSQFMENWAYDKETIRSMSGKVDTGETLPDVLFDKIVKARRFRAGTQMAQQLLYGTADMTLHDSFNPDGSETPYELFRRVAQDTIALAPLPESRFLNSFNHIFSGGYAAGYYGYKWSEVMSADLFGAFEEVLDDPQAVTELGRKLLRTLYAVGGGRDPVAEFRDFRGRDYDIAALLRQYGLEG